MNSEQFAYWLNGFVEMNGAVPSDEQWKMIKEHLQTVFHKVTPPMNPNYIDIPNWENPSPSLPHHPHHPTIIC